MSSELLGAAQNVLKGNLGGAWDINKGYADAYTDLGIARRFGGSSAAYSLRDIGAMNGRVVKARRDVGETSDPEEDFSANQVKSGALEDWVNGKLESTLPADSSQGLTVVVQHSLINSGTETTIKFYADSLTSGSPRFFSNDKTYKFYKGLSDNRYILQLTDSTNLIKASASDADKLPQDVTTYESVTGTLTSITVTSSSPAAAAYSLRKVDSSYSGDAVRIRRSSDDIEVDVAFDSDDKVSASSVITNIAEQGGEIGSTTATTLGDFISGTDAFVHTWYDQAGSNNAVQETDANQPKIAESGALLADGLDFDGTDSLVTGSFSASQPITIFSVSETDVTTGTRIVESETNTNLFYYGSAVQIGFTSGTNLNSAIGGYSINVPYLITHLANGSSSKIFRNSSEIASGNAGTNAFAGSLHIGGSSNHLNGRFRELVIYDSDQSDNRFKIESNINNYYGLYNDANAFSANAQVDGTGSTVSNASKDGGTLTLSSASGNNYLYFQLTETVPATSGDVFVSFNYESSNESVTLNNAKLRDDSDSAKSGDLVDSSGSSITIQKNGFYSGKLASANLTNTGTRLAFLTNQTTDGYTFTISNLRYSRIARNGFVETWYDQSANLRDAIQGTATNQPSIVQNGGIVKVNTKPTISFDGNDNFLEVDGSGSAVAYSFSPSGDMGMFIVSKQFTGNVMDSRDAGSDGIFLQQASSNTTRFRYNGDGSIDITATRDAQHFSTMTLDGTTLSASVDGGTAGTDTVTAGVSTTSNLVLGKAFSGNNSNFVDGEIQEAIFYENNKTSEKSDIETDIDNFYSIT